MYGCESWTIKKAEQWRIDAFELWCWKRLLIVPWTARRSNQSILKEISPGYFFGRNDAKAETPVLWPPHTKSWLIGKDWCWEGLGAGGEGDDRGWDGWMASLIHGRESEWTPGVGDRQGCLACCDSWCRKELETTEWMNWTELTNTTQDSGHVSFCYTDHYGKKWQNLNGIWRLDSSDYPLTYWFWWLNHSHVGKCPCLQETALLWGMMDHHIAIYFKLTSICYSCSVFFLSLRLLQWYIKCEKLIIIYNLVTWITEKQNLAKFRSLFFYQGSLICTYVDEYLYILLIYIYVLENKHSPLWAIAGDAIDAGSIPE